ncbi:MAG: RIP metalloprotease RseP [Pseudomonadota bacterium]
MPDVLISIIAFILALGILVTFHEYGHYWVAKKCGVKVLRFSVGFGKPLWRRVGGEDQTEYVVAAIPLGGYVKMLDEREGDVEEPERHRAFNRQPVASRVAIVAAGPIANFILAIATYWVMYVIGISGVAPIVGEVQPASVAEAAGFIEEDRIVAVGDTEVTSWDGVRFAIFDSSFAANGSIVTVSVVDKHGFNQTRVIENDFSGLLKQDGDLIANMGLRYWWPKIDAVIAGVQEGSPAQAAGLREGDRIIAADGSDIGDWIALVEYIRARPAQHIELLVQRGGRELSVAVTTGRRDHRGQEVGFIGAWEGQSQSIREQMRATTQYGVFDAFTTAVKKSWDMSVLTVQMLGRLLTGQAALSNISGPVTIAQIAGQTAVIGIDHYLNFIAIISISLGILNLLPIPILDGGHLLYFLIEWVKGSPLSENVQLAGQQLGIVLLGALMCLAFYNDIWRLMQ